MAGTLFVVATPIGHLDDITLRALRVLREAAVVAAEDTRRTGNLLRHYGIRTPLVSVNAHNELTRAAGLLRRLHEGQAVALVSDAGTPSISDPGALVVRRARAEGIRVEAIPGPSAVAAAVSVSGLEDAGFAFLGFPPVRSKDRTQWLERCSQLSTVVPVVLFEAPHRLRRTLEDLSNLVNYPISVFRELTKIHEEALTGTISELLERLPQPQGEFTIVIPRARDVDAPGVVADESIIKDEFGRLTDVLLASSPREIARQVGRKFGLSTKQVYELTRHRSRQTGSARSENRRD